MAAQRDSVIAFARYCLPQVFFYGMFVLVGQVLNARGRFGPMMWAPIANNVIAIVVLVLYLVWFGPLAPADGQHGVHRPQELLLGLGSTLGIVVQMLVLLPYLRGGRGPLPAALRLPAQRARATPCGSASGPCSSSWSTRSPTPSSSAWRRAARPTAAAAATTRHPGRDGLHRLRRRLPLRDGARTRSSPSRWRPRCCPGSRPRRRRRPDRDSAGDPRRTLRTALALVVPFAVAPAAGGLRRRQGAVRVRRRRDDVRPLRDLDDPVRAGRACSSPCTT